MVESCEVRQGTADCAKTVKVPLTFKKWVNHLGLASIFRPNSQKISRLLMNNGAGILIQLSFHTV